MAVPKIFPLEAPIRPEGRQIGRGPSIDALEQQVVGSAQHTLLFAERHVGKTSMAWAVLDRVRAAHEAWAIEVNLSRGPIETSAQFATRLAEQARAASIRLESTRQARLGRVKNAAKKSGAPSLRAAARSLGLEELADASFVAQAIDQALGADDEEGRSDLREVLRGIQAAGIAAERPIVLFVDEVQRLCTHWKDEDDSVRAQEALAEVMEHPDGRVVMLLAGSEQSAIEQLLAPNRPLHRDGMIFDVPPISNEDWQYGLKARFSEIQLDIAPERIEQILHVSGGHPQRTMRVCAHVQQLAGNGMFAVNDLLVTEAAKLAKRHPSWSE